MLKEPLRDPCFMPRLRLLLLPTLLCLALPAVAKDVYVDNQGGDDLQNGGAPRSVAQGVGPTRTITRALQLADDGDRVVIANTGEPYREAISIQGGRHSASPTQAFVIEANGAILDGSIPVPDDAWEHHEKNVFRFQPPRMSYQELFYEGVPLELKRPDKLGGPLPELKAREWCLHDRHIYFCCDPDRLPETYALRMAGEPVGVTLYQVHGVVIRDLIVQGFQIDGISAANGVRDSRLVGCTARGNGRAGVSVTGSSKLILEECTLGDNRDSQLRTDGWSTTEVLNSNIYANTAPAWRMFGKSRLLLNGEPAPSAVGDKDVLSGETRD